MSCRFQPDYRGDADYRGIAALRTEPCLDFTFDITTDIYIPTPVIPGLIPMDGFIDLACYATETNIAISKTSPHSFYRTTDRTTNQGYLARFFTVNIVSANKCAIQLSNVSTGFFPYITVN